MGPIRIIVEDMPPEIVNASAPAGGTISLERDGQKVFVAVLDEDPANLTWFWILEGEGRLYDAETFADGFSQVALDADPELDGRALECRVRDTADQEVGISWTLEVPR